MIKLGILGCSKIANRLMPTLLALDHLQIIGAASSELSRTKDFCQKFHLKSFNSYEHCLSSPDIQAVYISVLNSDHYHLIKLALEKNKHVLCEKPLVLKHSEAIEVFQLAKERGLILIEGFMYRFHPQILRAIEIIRSGNLGKIKSISCDFSFILETHNTKRRTREGGGGAIADLGCYCIDFINLLLQTDETPLIQTSHVLESTDQVNSVQSRSAAVLLFKKESILVTIHCAIDSPSQNIWEVRCEKGSISIPRVNPQGSDPVSLTTVDEESHSRVEQLVIQDGEFGQFKMEFKNFVESIEGLSTPFITPQESIRNAVLLEALLTSSH